MQNRKQYQQRFLRLIRKVQDTYREAVYEAIRAQINYFANNYTGSETPTYLPTQKLRKALRGIYETAGYNNGKYVRQSIKRDSVKADMTPGERLRWMINEYYRQNLLDQAVVPITNTTRKQIMQVLNQANEEGWGVDKTVAALKQTDITRTRAELIVRTETMRAANAGAMLGAADMGIAVNKEWISAQDNRTRRIPRDQYDHLHMDGKQTGYTEAFIIPSTKSIDSMLYPGDPQGSAGNVCNCRCTMAFVPIRDQVGRPVSFDRANPVGSLGNTFLRIAQQAAQITITTSLIQQLIEEIEAADIE